MSNTPIRGVASLRFKISLAVLLATSLSAVVQAQVSTTGKITRVVTDASGAVISTATVTVKSPALMADRSVEVRRGAHHSPERRNASASGGTASGSRSTPSCSIARK